MKHYSEERKSAVLAKMMPPQNISISVLAEETGISLQTLYNWRQKARDKGFVVPGDSKNSEKWSSADKFAAVLETAALNESELSAYCRQRGLYPNQIKQWRMACEQANDWDRAQNKRLQDNTRNADKKVKELQKELI